MKLSAIKLLLIFWSLFIILLHLVAAVTKSALLWGLDSWAFSPLVLGFSLWALATLFIIPASAKQLGGLVLDFAAPAISFFRKSNVHLAALIVATISVVLFWLLRCQIHLLGDGYLLIRNLEAGVMIQKNEPLAVFLNWLTFNIAGQFAQVSARSAYQLVSVLSGAAFVYLSFLLADRLGNEDVTKFLIFSGMLTLGIVQLFFGYVESYPPLIAAVMLYILFAVEHLEGSRSALWPSIAFLLCVLMHLSAFALAPSLVYLYYQWWRKSRKKKRFRPHAAVAAGLISGAAILLLIAGLRSESIFSSTSISALPFIPFVPDSSRFFSYSLFSYWHLIDLLNLVLLVSPFCLPLCLILLGKGKSVSRIERFFLAASVFPLAAMALFNPELGFPVDWDVFSYSLIPPTLLGLMLLKEVAGGDKDLLRYAATVITAVGLVHTVPWVLIQSDTGRSIKRHEHLLAAGAMHSNHAKSFAHDGLAVIFREKRQLVPAVRHYIKAIEATPEYSRLWVSLAATYYRHKQLDKALLTMKKAYEKLPESAEVNYTLASYLSIKGNKTDASHHYQEAVRIQPDNFMAWYNLGTILLQSNENEEAVGYFEKAIEIKPDFIPAHYNLGTAFANLGLLEKAIRHYSIVLRLDPYNKAARQNLNAAQMEYSRSIRR